MTLTPNQILRAKLAAAAAGKANGNQAQEVKEVTKEVSVTPVVSQGQELTPVVNPTKNLLGETTVAIPVAQETHALSMKLAELESALEQKLPGHGLILREIHQTLRQDPAVVTILSEEEIGLIVKGLKSHGNLTIPVAASKGSKKKTQPVTADML